MKRNIIKSSLALAVAIAAGYITYSSQTETQLSEVALENIEAIASGESRKVVCANIDGPCSGDNMGSYLSY